MELNRHFSEIANLIHVARNSASKVVNIELINLYWNIGYISNRIANAEWGQSVVQQLADYLQKNEPDLKGFSDKNLWRMKQFYEAYIDYPKLSPLVRELSRTNNLTILARTKTIEEKEFYLRICKEERYSKRELERQISSSLFERVMIGNAKISPALTQNYPNISNSLKDSYVFEFLNLPEPHNESDLHEG